MLKLKYLFGGHKWLAHQINEQVNLIVLGKPNIKRLEKLRKAAGLHYDIVFEHIKREHGLC